MFSRKLFENPVEHELTWARWYFPLINTADSLKIIDEYCQSRIRYLATGKHTKAAYNFRYEEMKELGYVSLVNRYDKQGGKEDCEYGKANITRCKFSVFSLRIQPDSMTGDSLILIALALSLTGIGQLLFSHLKWFIYQMKSSALVVGLFCLYA